MGNIPLEKFFAKAPDIEYPLKVIETVKVLSAKQVFAFTSRINGYTISSLMISINKAEMQFFDIGFPTPKPLLKFRMLDAKKSDYLFEILLRFKNRKTLRLHLNPYNEIVRKYLANAKDTEIIAIHFYNLDTHEVTDSITNLNEEEIGWVERNYLLSKNLKSNNGFEILSAIVDKTMTNKRKERCYQFNDVKGKEFLIETASETHKNTPIEFYTKN